MKKLFLGLIILGALNIAQLDAKKPSEYHNEELAPDQRRSSDFYYQEHQRITNPGFFQRIKNLWNGYKEYSYSKHDLEFLRKGQREGVLKRWVVRGLLRCATPLYFVINKNCWENGKFANLEGANLSNITITDALKEELQGANFKYAKLSEVTFEATDLKDADFSKATLEEVTFKDVDAKRARFEKAKLGTIAFKNTDLKEASFQEAKPLTTMDTVIVQESNLIDTNFTNATLNNLHIEKTDATRVDMENTKIGQLKVENSDFSDANFFQTRATETEIEKSNFSSASMVDAQLPEARITNAWFSGADLTGTNFKACTLLDGVHFEPRGPKCTSTVKFGYQDPKTKPRVSYWKWVPFAGNTADYKIPFHIGANDYESALLVQTDFTKADLRGFYGWKNLQHAQEIYLVDALMGGMSKQFLQQRNEVLSGSRHPKPLMAIFSEQMKRQVLTRETLRKEGIFNY